MKKIAEKSKAAVRNASTSRPGSAARMVGHAVAGSVVSRPMRIGAGLLSGISAVCRGTGNALIRGGEATTKAKDATIRGANYVTEAQRNRRKKAEADYRHACNKAELKRLQVAQAKAEKSLARIQERTAQQQRIIEADAVVLA